jgi:dTDP-glucose 4,6-dehydratase
VGTDHPFGLDVDLAAAFERAHDDFVALGDARILLTGGTGFVGSWLLELATFAADQLACAPEILVITRDPARFGIDRPHLARHRCVTLVEGDVRRALPITGSLDLVIAGASANQAMGVAPDDETLRTTTIEGARRTGELLEMGAGRALYLSSGAAARAEPDVYGQAKLDAEELLTGSNSRTVVARLFAFVGPYLPLDLHFAVGNFLADLLAGRPIEVAGDGTAVRSYLFAADLAWWLWALAVRGDCDQRYDVGSDRAVSIRDLAERVGSLVDPKRDVIVEGRAIASSASKVYVADTASARSLGLYESITLDDALASTLAWHRRRRAAI